MSGFLRLRLLDRNLFPPDVRVSVRALRRRAKDLGQCYVISRQVLVSEEQLAAILESYRVVGLRNDPRLTSDVEWRTQKILQKLR